MNSTSPISISDALVIRQRQFAGETASEAASSRQRSHHRKWRARSSVIGSVVSLVLLNLILTATVNSWPTLRDPTFFILAERFREHRASADSRATTIVFLGSSRTGDGIRPALVEELVANETGRPCVAYNVSGLGNGPVGELIHWRRLLDRGLRPDVVVIEITLVKFPSSSGVAHEASMWHGPRLTPGETKFVQQYGIPATVEDEWVEANANPWFGFRFQLISLLQPKWVPPGIVRLDRPARANLGWHGPTLENYDPVHWQKAAEASWPNLEAGIREVTFDGPPAAAFRETVRSALESGTAVAIWVSPEATAIREWYSDRVNQGLADFLSEFRAAGLVVEDGRDWFPDEAFRDGHHPVRNWTEAYTRKVTQSVVLPTVGR